MEKKEINEKFKAAKAAYSKGVKNPLKVVNILNSAAFNAVPEVKAARQAIGANKWHMDLATKSVNGRICKLGRTCNKREAWELELLGDTPAGVCAFAVVDGELFECEELATVTGPAFMDLCKKKANIIAAHAEKAQKAANKEAKAAADKKTRQAKAAADKAKKAADKKRRDAIDLAKLSEFEAWLASQNSDTAKAVNE